MLLEWQIESSPEEMWPIISDTDTFNRLLGLQAVHSEERINKQGGIDLIECLPLGPFMIRWKVTPYEWVSDYHYTIDRHFLSGPAKELHNEVRLRMENGKCWLTYEINLKPRHWLLKPIVWCIVQQTARGISKAVQKSDAAIQAKRSQELRQTPEKIRIRARQKEFAVQASERLVHIGYEKELVDKLLALILKAPTSEVLQFRPFEQATLWGIDRFLSLELCLSATKLGLLSMEWLPRCPLCRAANYPSEELSDLHHANHCPTCEEDFEADLGRNVEVTFSPHPRIRHLKVNNYCLANIQRAAHIYLRKILAPGEILRLNKCPPKGKYRIRSKQIPRELWETLSFPHPQDQGFSIQLSPRDLSIEDAESGIISIENLSNEQLEVCLENTAWEDDAATGTHLITLQKFCDLFHDQVISKEEAICVQQVSIVFTDLLGSTKMYKDIGDAPAFALVKAQFSFLKELISKNHGSLVKTIGDSVMAAFHDPGDALTTALEIQSNINKFNQDQPPEQHLNLRIGIHAGPCIAVNTRETLDYFGSTVNLAARLEGAGRGNDVAVSESFMQEPEVVALLKKSKLTIETEKREFKGFEEGLPVYLLSPISLTPQSQIRKN